MTALAPLGRLLFAAIFLLSGLNHFTQLDAMAGYAASAGLPAPRLAVLVSGVVLLGGGLSVLLGAFTRLGAGLLALFLLVSAFTVHDFWNFQGEAAAGQMIHFMKNLSMAGGALLLMYFGAGPVSVDARRRGREGTRRGTEPGYGMPLRPRGQE